MISIDMSYEIENLSAEYNIYYGENVNYDDIINSFVDIKFINDGSHNGFNIYETSANYFNDADIFWTWYVAISISNSI